MKLVPWGKRRARRFRAVDRQISPVRTSGRSQDRRHGTHQHTLLIHAQHVHPDRAVRSVDPGILAAGGLIGPGIDPDARPVHPAENTPADSRDVLADPTAENDTIAAPEHGKKSPQALTHAVAI